MNGPLVRPLLAERLLSWSAYLAGSPAPSPLTSHLRRYSTHAALRVSAGERFVRRAHTAQPPGGQAKWRPEENSEGKKKEISVWEPISDLDVLALLSSVYCDRNRHQTRYSWTLNDNGKKKLHFS